MFRRTVLAKSLMLAFGGAAALYGTAAVAQDASQPAAAPTQLERVTVTGSNIKRTDIETASPVQVITADDLKKSGYTTVSQVLSSITANGQGTLSQGFSGAFASGASGVALRGLTVGATLVLIDGHRMAPYPIGDDGQRSFVDISNIPFDSIERIEVLKDGASAIYGSEAVAGVVNVILKRSFVGKTFTVDGGSTFKGGGKNGHIAGTVGFGDLVTDGHNFYISGEYRAQTQITFADRGGAFTNRDFSSTGGLNLTNGVPNASNGNLPGSATGYLTDANGNILGFRPGCDAAKQAAGQCSFANTWSQIQPRTSNVNLVARYTQNLTSDWQLSLQGTYFDSKSQQVSSPSAAFTGGYQGITSGPGVIPSVLAPLAPTSISSTNPSFASFGAPAGTTTAFLNYNFLDLGPNITETNARSTRLIADLQGHIGSWDTAASIGFTEVRLGVRGLNYVNPANLQTALDSTTDPYIVGGPNTDSVTSFIAPTLTSTDTSKLSFAHVNGSRELATLSGGPLTLALGADFFHRSQNALAPEGVAAGFYSGSFSNNYTVGSQTVGSAYVEVDAPLIKKLDADFAVRYDHYNLSGGHFSPKIGLKYEVTPAVTVRGTAAGGFRAPSPAENGSAGQTFFAGSTTDPVLCPNPDNISAPGNFPSQCSAPVGFVQGTNPALKPETSQSYTLGLILQPTKEVSATLDFYTIQLNHQIVSGGPQTLVRGANFAPIPQVQADGSLANVAPPVAPYAYIGVGYINANTTSTNGLDVDLQYKHRFEGFADWKSDFMVSYVNKYDLTIDGTTYHLAGTHGPFVVSGDTGNPRTRFQWSNTFAQGPLQITGAVNYVSSFSVTDPSAIASAGNPQDTCAEALVNTTGNLASAAFSSQLTSGVVPGPLKCRVTSLTTFDVTGRYQLSKQLAFTGSVLNVFNAGAPTDSVTYGGGGAPYNPSLHLQGAIGRSFNVGATYTF